MTEETARQRGMRETHERILAVALETLGRNPAANMEDIARGAGVVRRTVYGHFPTREDLVRELVSLAMTRVSHAFESAQEEARSPLETWKRFVAALWEFAPEYRTLLLLRRTDYSQQIHATAFGPLIDRLTTLISTGQREGQFTALVPARALTASVEAILFALIDLPPDVGVDANTATITTLLALGALAADHPSKQGARQPATPLAETA